MREAVAHPLEGKATPGGVERRGGRGDGRRQELQAAAALGDAGSPVTNGGDGEAGRGVGSVVVETGERKELRMGSVEVVAESNGDGQAPGGAARGTPAMNWWGGETRGDEGKLVDRSGGE